MLRNRIERHVTCPFRSAADSLRENISDMQCFWAFTENFVACYFTDVLRDMYWGFYAQGAIWSAHLLLLWQPPGDVTRMYIVHSSMPPCPSCEDRMKLACVTAPIFLPPQAGDIHHPRTISSGRGSGAGFKRLEHASSTSWGVSTRETVCYSYSKKPVLSHGYRA